MKYIKKFSTIATATGLGALLATGLTGCGESKQQQQEQTQAKGAFVIIEETAPGKYKIKVIFDRNNNGRWDTGNYIEKEQPENVLFFNKLIEIRPNWVSEESMEI